ncbi:MAG: hypothetical protein K2G59_06030 [Muribaculaceae bacterium]|nr:hypothetical protein [Muribaculaceae bacterium]
MQRRHINPIDTVATSSGTSVLLGVAAIIASIAAPGGAFGASAMWLIMAVAMLPVIRHYNLSQSNSPIACAMFLMFQAAMTPIIYWPVSSWMLAATGLAGCALLFSVFQNQQSARPLFTLTLMSGIGMTFSWVYIPLTVIFLIGTTQMRALNMRSAVAMLLGLITGPLLIYGFGLRQPAVPDMPYFAIDAAADPHLYLSAGFSAICSIVFGGCCMLTSYGYQAKLRAFNAFIYLLTAMAICVTIADSGNASSYITLLNMCAAYHTGHFIVSRSRGWIAVAVTVTAISALYIWNSWM